jgi:CDP-diacylglycerol---glycerol-3-phosphate 3-phosphatidyltransferase
MTNVPRSVIDAMVPRNVPNVLTVIPDPAGSGAGRGAAGEDQRGRPSGGGVFAVASLTDAIDGSLARSRHWVTTFGKMMDPIADKLLMIAAELAPRDPGGAEI